LRRAFRCSDNWFDCAELPLPSSPSRDDVLFESFRMRLLQRLFCTFIHSLKDVVLFKELDELPPLLRLVMPPIEMDNFDVCCSQMRELFGLVHSRPDRTVQFNLLAVLQPLQRIISFFVEFFNVREIVELLQNDIGMVNFALNDFIHGMGLGAMQEHEGVMGMVGNKIMPFTLCYKFFQKAYSHVCRSYARTV
jgi:hypothetical protein